MPIEIHLTGIGPRGDIGPQGPPGDIGGAYTHIQDAPSDTWDVVHGLGYHPSVTVVDSAGSVVEGDVEYLDATAVTVRFSVPFAGVAYMS